MPLSPLVTEFAPGQRHLDGADICDRALWDLSKDVGFSSLASSVGELRHFKMSTISKLWRPLALDSKGLRPRFQDGATRLDETFPSMPGLWLYDALWPTEPDSPGLTRAPKGPWVCIDSDRLGPSWSFQYKQWARELILTYMVQLLQSFQ